MAKIRAYMKVPALIWNHPANRGRRLRQLAIAADMQVRTRILRRPVTVPFGDDSIILSQAGQRSGKAAYGAYTDYPEMMVWRRYFREVPRGSIFVDVGANVGFYSLIAAESGMSVIAIEPGEEQANLLTANAMINNYYLTVVRAAATASGSDVHLATGLDSKAHVTEPGAVPSVRVAGVRLDDLIGDRAIAGLKIDVEGFEDEALQGMSVCLSEHRVGLMQIEWNRLSERTVGRPRSDLANMLLDLGYAFARPGPDGRLHPVATTIPEVGDDVFCFVAGSGTADLIDRAVIL